MEIEQLREFIEIDLVQKRKPKQAVIDKYLSEIELILEDAYTLPLINSVLDVGLSNQHFQTLIQRARKKIKKSKAVQVNESHITTPTKKSAIKESPLKKESKESSAVIVKNNDLLNELKTLFPDISNHLTNDIERLGFGFDDVKNWKSEFKLSSSTLLRKHVSKLKDKALASQYHK